MNKIDVKAFLNCTYQAFPSCCLMGIISGFAGTSKPDVDKKKLEEFEGLLERKMRLHGHTSVIFTDVESGPGFRCLSGHPKVMILGTEFNKNSGNFVYVMQYFV